MIIVQCIETCKFVDQEEDSITNEYPFPGMNPYLETYLWPNMCLVLATDSQRVLVQQIAPNYYTSVERRTYYAPPNKFGIRDRFREYYIEARQLPTHQVVTNIEILKPEHKQIGKERTRYLRRRRKILKSPVNFVEIDLLRDGKPFVGSSQENHYRIWISRYWERDNATLYSFDVTQPIPTVSIPLHEGEDEPLLALGDLIKKFYVDIFLSLRIDYTQDPEPNLSHEYNQWLHTILQDVGLRP
ncbi:MAG: DUF4058 family protein [Chloroflexota bacterium]